MTTVDDRVVSMKFDNAQFQKNIGETQQSLENLKKNLNFDGVKKSFDGITDAANKVDISRAGAGVETLQAKFSGLQAIALGVFATIGAKAVQMGIDLAKSIAGSLTQDIRAGYSDYELKLTSVQTIMNATGESIEVVNGYFNELDEYADKTIYNLQDMTSAFAKFTNAGIDMDKAIPAIKGIANMVALAGQGAGAASIAMYNLSQSLAGGFLTTTDYKSLNLANVATKEWKDQMIAGAIAAGTLQKVGGDAYHIVGTKAGTSATAAALFNQELASGWASADVLLDVLGKYGDVNTEIGKKAFFAATKVKSFSMMMETLKAAAGTGWTRSFELFLGDVTESTEFFTKLTYEVQRYTDAAATARNAQLEIWKDNGGREAIFGETGAILNLFKALRSVLEPLGEAWNEVFPPSLGDTLTTISFALRDFTKGLILSDEAGANLKMVAKGLFTVLKFGFDIIGGVISVLWNTLTIVVRLGSAFFGLLKPVLTFIRSLIPMEEAADGATFSIGNIFQALVDFQNFITGPLIDGIKNVGEGMDSFLNDGALSGRVQGIIGFLRDLGGAAASTYNILFKGKFTDNAWFSEDSPFVAALFKIREIFIDLMENSDDFAKNASKAVKAVFQAIAQGFTDAFGNIDWSIVLSALNTGLIGAVVFSVIKAISDIKNMFKGADLLGGLGKSIDALTGVLQGMQSKLKAEALKSIAAAILILAAGLLVLSLIDPERLVSAATGLGAAVGILLGATFVLSKISGNFTDMGKLLILGAVMIQLATAMSILSVAIRNLGSMDIASLARGLGALVLIIAVMVKTMQVIGRIHKQVAAASAALLIMAVALNMLVAPVVALGLLPWNVLVQGMVSLGVLLYGLIGAFLLISKVKKDIALAALALLSMSVALNALIGPLTVLGLLPFNVLVQGMAALGIMLLGLVTAALLISKVKKDMMFAAAGIAAMAFALNLLVGPLTILGFLPFGNLIQGLFGIGLALAAFVIAAKAMSGAQGIAGAAGLLALSAAMFVMATALAVVASIPTQAVFTAVGALALLLATVAVFGAIFGAASAVFFTGSLVLLAFSGALLVLSAAIVVAAIGISMLGPALISLVGGLIVFSKASEDVVNAAGPMALIGATLIVLGAGALIAGIGLAVLGAALIILGTGFALVGATALIGATALTAAFAIMVKLIDQIGPMALLGVALIALGAGVLALGAGLVLVGAGALLFATAMLIISVAGLAVIPVLTALIGLIPVLLVAIANGVVQFTETIRANIPTFVATAVEMVMGFLAGIQQVVPEVVATVLAMIQSVLDGIVAAVPMFLDAGMRLVTGILNGIKKRLPRMMNAAGDLIAEFIRGLGDQALKIAKAGGDTVLKFINGITDYIKNNSSKFTTAGSRLFRAVVDGISAAIRSGAGDLAYAGQQIASALWDGATSFMKINSPSKKFRDEFMPAIFEGIEDGGDKNIRRADKVGGEIGSTMFSAVKKSLSDISSAVMLDPNMQPTIKPVLDLSDVKRDSSTLNSLLRPPDLVLQGNPRPAEETASYIRREKEARAEFEGDREVVSVGDQYNFTQNITSPKVVPVAEVYRLTNNQIAKAKKGRIK